MILSELGHFALILSLFFAGMLSVVPMVGSYTNNLRWMGSAPTLAVGMFVFTLIAYAILTYGFVTDDFSLSYVANHSNSLLPLHYKVTAVWGGHEGSFLLWVLMFTLWTLGVALFSRGIPTLMLARVLSVLGIVACGFYLFMLWVSDPFLSLLPFFPVDGQDLNPLLQDFGMIIHPPMLYMGYVGFAVAFSFAIAALLSGKLDSAWARWSRPWALAAWGFLTVGLALGSWWAYYELGWGGWWFWDPSENAALMPWLAGTALIHSLAITEKRKIFKSWTVLLAICAFSLSLLGTFLIRSGVLVSVHTFASDPSRGLFILGMLVVVIGSSLLLYALRASSLKVEGRYGLISREVMLFGNNVLLSVSTLVVLVGTLLPLVHQQLGRGAISVGEPFFNQMFTLLIVPFALLVGIGPLTRWKSQAPAYLLRQMLYAGTIALAAALLLVLPQSHVSYLALLGFFLAFWVLVNTVEEVRLRVGKPFNTGKLTQLSLSHWGMVLGHIGFAILLTGIAMVSNYGVEKDVKLSPGESVELSGYRFAFEGVKGITGPNYRGNQGRIVVYRDNQKITELLPEKRQYNVQKSVMTEAGIDSNLWRDLFVALGEPLGENQWAVRVYYKPLVVWIWLGAAIMALGALCSICDKRYRVRVDNKRAADIAHQATPSPALNKG